MALLLPLVQQQRHLYSRQIFEKQCLERIKKSYFLVVSLKGQRTTLVYVKLDGQNHVLSFLTSRIGRP
jgi:hypothetical protein